MALELSQIKQILLKPEKKQTIQKASLMQKRLRFHTETCLSLCDINQPATIFLEWVSKLLPKDKYNTILQLFKYPIQTPSIVEDIYRELERVFYSRNSSSSYQFTADELLEDWQNYRREHLKEPDIWKTTGLSLIHI